MFLKRYISSQEKMYCTSKYMIAFENNKCFWDVDVFEEMVKDLTKTWVYAQF